MSRDKQIEEMAKDVKIAHDEEKYLTSDKSIKIIAEHLYNAGYRKASDLAEEIFAEIDKEIHFYYDTIDIFNTLAELKIKYTESEDTK